MRKRPFYSGNIFLCGDVTMIYACFGITCRSWSCICAAVWGNFGIKFLKSSNKIYKKRNVYVFLYMFYTNILCECVCVPQKWVKLAQMLQLFACSTLKHFYLPRLQQVFAAQTHTNTHAYTYVYTYIYTHTHTYALPHTHLPRLASTCIQVKYSPYAFMLTLL